MTAAICGGAFEHGGKLTAPITLLDFAPSLLDACGVPVPDAMQVQFLVTFEPSLRSFVVVFGHLGAHA